MRLRAPTLNPGAALAAAMLLALPGHALAEDASPPAAGAATPPVVEEVTPPASPAATPQAAGNAGEPAKETNICFTGQGSIKEVLDACSAYIAAGPGDKEHMVIAHSVRAMGMSATGDYDGALAEMTAAVETDPARANSYFMRAAAYETKKDYDKAVADLDKAISLDAKQGDFFLLRGIVYRDKNDLDKALADMTEKVKLDPELTNGYTKRGDLFRLRKEYDLSIADFGEVIKREPDGPKGYIDRGWVYVLKGDLDSAGTDFDTALRIKQNEPSALVGRPTAPPTLRSPSRWSPASSIRSGRSASSSRGRRLYGTYLPRVGRSGVALATLGWGATLKQRSVSATENFTPPGALEVARHPPHQGEG
jgi:tetratricopeptide (TPR) repeat protein